MIRLSFSIQTPKKNSNNHAFRQTVLLESFSEGLNYKTLSLKQYLLKKKQRDRGDVCRYLLYNEFKSTLSISLPFFCKEKHSFKQFFFQRKRAKTQQVMRQTASGKVLGEKQVTPHNWIKTKPVRVCITCRLVFFVCLYGIPCDIGFKINPQLKIVKSVSAFSLTDSLLFCIQTPYHILPLILIRN